MIGVVLHVGIDCLNLVVWGVRCSSLVFLDPSVRCRWNVSCDDGKPLCFECSVIILADKDCLLIKALSNWCHFMKIAFSRKQNVRGGLQPAEPWHTYYSLLFPSFQLVLSPTFFCHVQFPSSALSYPCERAQKLVLCHIIPKCPKLNRKR